MNPDTGDIHQGTAEELKAIELAALCESESTEPFIPLTSRQANVMKSKTPEQRRAIAKRVIKNRDKRKARKKARQSRR